MNNDLPEEVRLAPCARAVFADAAAPRAVVLALLSPPRTTPPQVFMAVNPKGILIINPDTKEVLSTYPYSEVPTWGHSQSSFVLHIGNLIRQTKLYFATEQGKEINDLVRSYVNHLVVSN